MVNRLLFPASSEFTALCRSQVSNLQEGLNADRGAVYLTKEVETGTRQLIPIVVYPEDNRQWDTEDGIIVSADDSLWKNTSFQLPASPVSSDVTSQLTTAQSEAMPDRAKQFNQHQVVFPLWHNNVMMGLLVVARQQAQWSEWEFTQIQRTAETITLACVLDQRQGLLQQKLQASQWQQEQQRDRLDDILHQLRNPLMALRTFGKLLLKRLKPEENAKTLSIAENLMRESDRLQELLKDMGDYVDNMGQVEEEEIAIETETTAIPESAVLRRETTEPADDRWSNSGVKSLPPSHPYSQIKFGSLRMTVGQSFPLEAVQLREVLQPILASTSAIAQDQQIELKTDIPQQLPPVKANSKALQEVLNNLLDNAIKYTPENGAIEVFLKQDNPQQQSITIRDNGLGIPAADQPKIFERHYRGIQSESDIPGTGLGLAIAKEYIEQMQGEIQLISPATPPNNPEKGTAFIVSLPTVEI